MARYKPYDYNQLMMIPVSLEEQLVPGTLEYVIHHLIEERIDTVDGRTTYGKRLGIVEPVFENIRAQKRLDQFTLRGKIKVNMQWMPLPGSQHRQGPALRNGLCDGGIEGIGGRKALIIRL